MKKLLLLLSVALFAACSSEVNEKKTTATIDNTIEKHEDNSLREPITFTRPDIQLPNSSLADFNRVKKKFKRVPFICLTQNGNLFLVSNTPYEPYSDEKKKKKVLFGLASAKGDTLLPLIYERISNPGIFSDVIVEVYSAEGYQLYDYVNKRFIGETYELIFPSNIMGYLAIGRKNGEFFKLYDDGTVKKIENKEHYPTYKSISKHLKINLQSEDFGLWVNTKLFTSEDKAYEDAGMYMAPSFIQQLKIFPDIINGITLKSSEFGIAELNTTEVKHHKHSKEGQSLILSFMEHGIEGRGYTTEQQHIVTVDKENKIKARKKLNSISDYSKQNSCADCVFSGTRFVNDSLLEVRYWVYADNDFSNYADNNFAKQGMDTFFIAMTQYSYFNVSSKGKIVPLHEGSLFPMASLVPLDQKMLEGCFLKHKRQFADYDKIALSYAEEMEEDDYMQWIAELNMLSADDIRFVINEIYARHGYIFSDRKMDAYFRSLKWYKPTSRNVDNRLTPLEKQNILFLQGMEKRLKNNERDLLKPILKYLVWAG
jgi:hypothetical protein